MKHIPQTSGSQGFTPSTPAIIPAALLLLCCLLPWSGLGRAATANEAADLLLLGGQIYTVSPTQPWVEALAVKDGKILATGSDTALSKYRSSTTKIIDLQGKMVMPGIIDAHLHPVSGGIKELFECNFPFTATPDDIARAVSQCVQEQPDSEDRKSVV